MSIFKDIGGFFKRLFGKQFKLFKENSALAVSITEALKNVVSSGAGDIITAIIPGDLDNVLYFRVKEVVNRVAEQMAVAHALIQASETNAQAWAAIISDLKTRLPDGRAGFWMEFSGRLNEALSDGKLSLAEAVALAQMVYVVVKERNHGLAVRIHVNVSGNAV